MTSSTDRARAQTGHAAAAARRSAAALLVVAATAILGICGESPSSAASIIAAFQEARWRFAIARRALPRVEAVQNETLEVEDWREYAYEGGALRAYVSRDGGNVIAVLADASVTRYADFRQLRDTDAYTVNIAEPSVIVIPMRPVGRSLFDRLKSKTWSVQELTRLLGPPSYRDHIHGIGWMFLEYVPQGLTFVDDSNHRPDYDWFYLWDWRPKQERDTPDADDDDMLDAPRGDKVPYESYRARLRDVARKFGDRLAAERREIRNALAGGLESPGGRFVVAPINLGGSYNNQQTLVAERARPERRYHAEYFTAQKDYRWLDARTILYEVAQPTGDVQFYTLDAITGAKAKAFEVSGNSPLRVREFGVSGRSRFWYTTSDAIKHEIPVSKATAHPAPSGAREP